MTPHEPMISWMCQHKYKPCKQFKQEQEEREIGGRRGSSQMVEESITR